MLLLGVLASLTSSLSLAGSLCFTYHTTTCCRVERVVIDSRQAWWVWYHRPSSVTSSSSSVAVAGGVCCSRLQHEHEVAVVVAKQAMEVALRSVHGAWPLPQLIFHVSGCVKTALFHVAEFCRRRTDGMPSPTTATACNVQSYLAAGCRPHNNKKQRQERDQQSQSTSSPLRLLTTTLQFNSIH